MKTEKDTREIILEAIKKANPSYVTIQDIADATKISRDTVSKYFMALASEGKIKKTKKIGKVNLYEAV